MSLLPSSIVCSPSLQCDDGIALDSIDALQLTKLRMCLVLIATTSFGYLVIQ
jgi:hypothetical protein